MKQKTFNFWSLAMKGAATLVAVAGVAMMYSCSDNDDDALAADDNNVAMTTELMDIKPSDNSRVANYKALSADTTAATRSGSPLIIMPEQPAVPADAIEITTNNPVLESGKNYVVKSGVTVDALNFQTQTANIYIENGADATFSNMWTGWPAGKLNIYILSGAKVTDKMNITNVSGVSVYNYSEDYTYSKAGSDFLIVAGSAFNTTEDFTFDRKIECHGDLYVGGNLTTKAFTTAGSGPDVYVVGATEVAEQMIFCQGSNAKFFGAVTADKLDFNGLADVRFDCTASFTTEAKINNQTRLRLNGGELVAPYIELNSGANLLLADGSKVWAKDKFYLANAASMWYTNGSQIVLDKGYAVVKTKYFATDSPELQCAILVSLGRIGLVYDGCGYNNDDDFNGNNGDVLGVISNVIVNEDAFSNVPYSECVPSGDTAAVEKDKFYLDHIASVTTSDDHDHDISATCVYIDGSNAYVSYHRREKTMYGCLESMTIDKASSKVSLVNYLTSPTQRDFNHLIVDNDMLLAVGNDFKKGGIIAKVPLVAGAFGANGSADSLEVVRLKGVTVDEKYARDGNCIVRSGDYYVVASTEGFETLNASDFASVDMKFTDASAKFVAVDKNDAVNHITLNLTNKQETETDTVADVEINGYTSHTLPLGTFNGQSYTIATVNPTNGKNVCKVDGSSVFACLGYSGFRVLVGGTQMLEWKPTEASHVNGVDYDNEYIYLACGSAGVYVLDKAFAVEGTVKIVAKYNKLGVSMATSEDELANITAKNSGLKSANYIAVDADKYIYVAFGRDGFQVFQLKK